MDAVEYIKEAKRLCKSRSLCNSVSGKCPLLDENGRCTATADICTEDIIEKNRKVCADCRAMGERPPCQDPPERDAEDISRCENL